MKIIIPILLLVLVSCDKPQTSQAAKPNEAANIQPSLNYEAEAFAALKKIDAATKYGVDYQQYNQLVLDAAMKVGAVPDDNKNKVNLITTVVVYLEARKFWNYCLFEDKLIRIGNDWGDQELLREFPLIFYNRDMEVVEGGDYVHKNDLDFNLGIMWEMGRFMIDSFSKEIE